MSWVELGIITAAVYGCCVLSAGVQASIGFGMGMLAFIVTLIVTIQEREHLDLKGAGWALIGRIPGSMVGAWQRELMVNPQDG